MNSNWGGICNVPQQHRHVMRLEGVVQQKRPHALASLVLERGSLCLRYHTASGKLEEKGSGRRERRVTGKASAAVVRWLSQQFPTLPIAMHVMRHHE